MALTTANPASRVGAKLGGSDKTELFLKLFSGEILTAFETNTVMKDLHTVRTISNGKQSSFPVSGIASASYHAAGQSLYANAATALTEFQQTEKIISIDDMLIASTFVAEFDELQNHFDIRSVYSSELGKALAKRFDVATLKTLFAAANADANISGQTAAGTVIDASSGGLDSAAEVIDALYSVATTLDENNAPEDGRFAILAPRTYYQLITADSSAVVSPAINRDAGGVGSIASGVVPQVAGISLFKSNNFQSIADEGDLSSSQSGADNDDGVAASGTTAGTRNDVHDDNVAGSTTNGVGYNANFSKLKSGSGATAQYGILAGTREAIGTVKLLDLSVQSEYQIERQGTLMVARYAMGHGVLRPECAVAVKVTS
tara:strand:+ start:164 stop:1288 length:1125 start_codon:yes stop_codon:yes gene_type:complete